ncbi:lymphocyte activation gene 3 protein isoform X2 [Peromyscus californicus insignis]|uniref:lymphocyte activation gene 3 protein isoform X2 n=1 Tax=Peromyscus californicus insignis TaxID=564181 RepID=UPI0022A6D9FD|nr:lymphocyte activation gene 3 protein isoform X2 [Peromyscus californicus insignis]
MREALLRGLLLLRLLWEAPVVASEPGKEDSVVWAQEGTPVQLPCSPQLPHRNLSFLRRGGVTWQHQPDGGQRAPTPAFDLKGRMPSPGRPAPRHPYTILSVAPGGLRSGRLPMHPRVQLEERGLQRGDFSLWLRPALRADAGGYHAVVRFPDRTLSCHLRLRVGQASMIAYPPGPLRPSDWVVLNCSFSRPDRPVSVHWFQGRSRVPVPKSSHRYLAESFLFLPQVRPLDSGIWRCVLTYRDGFNVSITYNLKVLGLEPLAPLTVYAAAGSRVELPCHLPPGVGTSSSLMAKWTPPGGGPERLVAGKNGNFTLHLEAVGLEQAGTYSCGIDLQGQWLSTTVTVAVITVTRQSFGLPGSPGKLLCEVTPASGQERFVWRPLNNPSRSSPGPKLEMQEARLLSEPWQCQLYQGQKLLGAALPMAESSPGARSAKRTSGDLKGSHLFLLLILGSFSLFLLVTGAFGFHLWRRKWLRRRFSALENGIHPPPAPSKTEELERELEMEQEREPEPELEQEPQLEPEPRPL